MKDKKTIILFILIVCALGYILSLLLKLDKANKDILSLGRQKQVLERDLTSQIDKYQKLSVQYKDVQDKLKVSEDKLVKIDADFKDAQRSIEELNSQISLLKVEGGDVRQQNERLTVELRQASQERDELQARMNSVTELKKAIKDLKKQRKKVVQDVVNWTRERAVYQPERREITLPKVKAIKVIEEDSDAIAGNQGFIIKNGRATYQSTVKIEVEPFNK